MRKLLIWRGIPNKRGVALCGLTHRGHKEITDLLAEVPLCHARGQGYLEHGVTLMNLPQPVEDEAHLFGVQQTCVGLQQRLLVLLRAKGCVSFHTSHSLFMEDSMLFKVVHLHFCGNMV